MYIHKMRNMHEVMIGAAVIWLGYIWIGVVEELIGGTITWAILWPLAIFCRMNILTDRRVFPMLQAEIVENEPMGGGGTKCTIH